MRLLLTQTGPSPKVGSALEEQQHRTAYARRERSELTDEEFEQVQEAVTAEVIQDQIEAGLDLVTDGQVRWYDPVSHIAGRLDGVKINGLLRFFDTNCYFRQPVVVGPICWRAPIIVEEYRSAVQRSARPVKPVLTGPYTLARLSVIETDRYRHLRELVLDYAQALAKEVAGLTHAGATVIQVDEPAVLQHPEDLPLVAEALRLLSEARGSSAIALHTYFGDAAPLYEALHDLPVQVLGLDFTYSPSLPDCIVRHGATKPVGLGLLDGRNTRLESTASVVAVAERLLPAIKAEYCFLHPSCGLEYLPRDRAREKLHRLKAVREALEGGRA